MTRVSVPTSAQLRPSLRVDAASPIVAKIMSRLSRPLSCPSPPAGSREKDRTLSTAPSCCTAHATRACLTDNDFYPPMETLAELREYYAELADLKTSKRDVLDRILEGDWRTV